MRSHSKAVLRCAITSDATFLSNLFVMDYSLVVGLDDISMELVVGIIGMVSVDGWYGWMEM